MSNEKVNWVAVSGTTGWYSTIKMRPSYQKEQYK